MPYDALARLNQDDPEEQNRAQQITAGGGPSVNGAGPTQYIAPAGGSAGSADNAGRFVNFGRYFDANQQKAAGVASGVAGGITSAAQQAQQQLQQRQNAFGQQVAAGTPGAFDTNRSYPSAAPNAHVGTTTFHEEDNTPTRTDASTPTQRGPKATKADNEGPPGALTPGELMNRSAWTRDELQRGASTGYTGPKDLGDTTSLATAFGGVQDRANALRQPGGVESELGRTYGALGFSPTSSTGNSRLEAGLAGAAGAPDLQHASDRYSNFMQQLTDAQNAAAGQATVAADAAEMNRRRYAAGLSDYDIANARANPQAITIGAAPGVGTGSDQLGSVDTGGPMQGFDNLGRLGFGDTQGNREWAIARDLQAAGLIPKGSVSTSGDVLTGSGVTTDELNGFYGFVRSHPEYADLTASNSTSTATNSEMLAAAWAAYQAWMKTRKGR